MHIFMKFGAGVLYRELSSLCEFVKIDRVTYLGMEVNFVKIDRVTY
jgi:hypothetical protein